MYTTRVLGAPYVFNDILTTNKKSTIHKRQEILQNNFFFLISKIVFIKKAQYASKYTKSIHRNPTKAQAQNTSQKPKNYTKKMPTKTQQQP
jgi:hypothetical protein